MMNEAYEKTPEEEAQLQPPPPPYTTAEYEMDGLQAASQWPRANTGYPGPAAAAATGGAPSHQWPSMPPAYSLDAKSTPGYGSPPGGAPPPGPQSMPYNSMPQHHQYGYDMPSAAGQQRQQQQLVIIQQPGPMLWTGGPLENPPDDYMGYSIFVTLCCCWLIGIFAIARSSECRSAIAAGDRVTAEIKSREALSKAHMALGFGIATLVVMGAILGVYYGLAFSRF